MPQMPALTNSASECQTAVRQLPNVQVTSLGTVTTHDAAACGSWPDIVHVTIRVCYPRLAHYDSARLFYSIRQWISKDQHWSLVGLQAHSVAFQTIDQSTSVVQFALTATGGTNGGERHCSADIRDLNPPLAVPVLHVSAIDLELLFSSAEQKPSHGHNQTQSLAEAWLLSLDEVDCQDPHNALADHYISLTLAALHTFFNATPAPGSKLCAPRMFKSSRLSDLAPGVFLPEYPQIIKPRQKLIPTLGRLLASFRRQRFVDDGAVKRNWEHHKQSDEAEWYEEKLWTSMVSALRMPARASPARLASASAVGPGYSTCKPAPDVLEVCKNREESFSVIADNEAYPPESPNELGWLSLFENDEVTDDEMLATSSADYSDRDSCLLDASESDEESFSHYPQQVAAKTSTRAHLGLTNPKYMGVIRRNSCDAELALSAECPGGALTHIDQIGKGGLQVHQERESCGMIGPTLLIHQPGSTNLHENNTDHQMREDVHISETAIHQCHAQSRTLRIRESNNEDEGYQFQFNYHPDSSEEAEEQLDTETFYRTAIMQSHSPRQSLSEVLGSDHLLWNIWKRRGSAAPPEAGDMLEMHTMFENDRDMRLLSSKTEDRSPSDDSMLYESFDFSRKSTQSSESSWTASPSDELFDEPLNDPKLYSQSIQSSTQSRTSLSTPKKPKRRPSVLQKIARQPRMSEDDILFQQSSPTRQVDIKKRKTLLDYHREQ